jgi:hypothetical protein
LVVAEEVELNFIGTGTRQIEVVEILTIWRHHRLVGYAVSVLPAGCLRSFGSPVMGLAVPYLIGAIKSSSSSQDSWPVAAV